MSAKTGSFTITSTGNFSITGLTFLPTAISFTLAGASGTDTAVRLSTGGASSSTSRWARSTFMDSTGGKSSYTNAKCIQHYKRSSGSIVTAVEADFVSFDTNGGGDFGFTVNATASDSLISIGFIAYS